VKGGTAGNDEDVVDDYVFAECKEDGGTFAGGAGAEGRVGADTEQGVFEDGDFYAGAGADVRGDRGEVDVLRGG
jgi:hypothetical protein